jgi:hypothetical protein
MNIIWILLIILLVFAVLGAPGVGPFTHNYGWAPSGLVTIIVVVLLILLLTGKL